MRNAILCFATLSIAVSSTSVTRAANIEPGSIFITVKPGGTATIDIGFDREAAWEQGIAIWRLPTDEETHQAVTTGQPLPAARRLAAFNSQNYNAEVKLGGGRVVVSGDSATGPTTYVLTAHYKPAPANQAGHLPFFIMPLKIFAYADTKYVVRGETGGGVNDVTWNDCSATIVFEGGGLVEAKK